ncbi:MAG: hypothetical protein ACK4KV_24115 [Rhodocyclaceae bacterium]
MLPRHVVTEHHVESLANFRRGALIALDTAQALSGLALRSARAHLVTPHAWTLAWSGGEAQFEIDSPSPPELMHEAIHILTDHYKEWVGVLASQIHLSHATAHSAVDALQQWTPRGTEFALAAVDLAVDASDASAVSLADVSVAVADSVDQESALTVAPKRASRRRTAS